MLLSRLRKQQGPPCGGSKIQFVICWLKIIDKDNMNERMKIIRKYKKYNKYSLLITGNLTFYILVTSLQNGIEINHKINH